MAKLKWIKSLQLSEIGHPKKSDSLLGGPRLTVLKGCERDGYSSAFRHNSSRYQQRRLKSL